MIGKAIKWALGIGGTTGALWGGVSLWSTITAPARYLGKGMDSLGSALKGEGANNILLPLAIVGGAMAAGYFALKGFFGKKEPPKQAPVIQPAPVMVTSTGRGPQISYQPQLMPGADRATNTHMAAVGDYGPALQQGQDQPSWVSRVSGSSPELYAAR